MNTTQTPAFENRDEVYAPLIAAKMAEPMPAHLQAKWDALRTDAQRAKFLKAREDGFRLVVHIECVRAGMWS